MNPSRRSARFGILIAGGKSDNLSNTFRPKTLLCVLILTTN
jgi:hypothetical protein